MTASAPNPPMVPSPSGPLPSAAHLQQLALAHRSSMVLFTASELDVFTKIHEGHATVDALAAACGVQREPLRMVLEWCVADGTLTFDGAHFQNTPATTAYLVKGQPAYAANGLKYAQDLYPAWGGLTSLVRTGRPSIDPESILGDDKAKTRAFIYAMHERARGLGSILPAMVDFSGRRRLLDVGGGPGTYSIALVQKTPGLTSTVLDLPGVLEITKEIVEANGCSDRVSRLPGNYLTTPFGSGFDCALLSGMMHREHEAECRLLLKKSFDAMEPGGLVVVSDVFFEDDRKNSPPFALSFALNMMLTSNHGSAHAKTEMSRWMTDAGFVGIEQRPLPPPNPHTLVIGHKP
ncbi:MAG TPA: methyltransferase [Vicinamibacterales bacterium]|nr:methyltransferase [Vicinamibacterales bacterium]